ncbi:ABC transporter C family member 9 [Camellia lanceoleosa]|uniref:ABC transporter C family member 9 n=1 Tax=Camellia lanceoleosa TaxID=1840588 RepID=A0ACC0IC78_9ERIC|nr:ABC transporter C family member 9 [Camellia lanceoleosa]
MLLEAMFNSSLSTDIKILKLQLEWPQQSSPCLSDEASILLQLGFLGILLVHFVWKTDDSLCKHRKKSTGAEKYPIGIKYGLSYKVSIAGSIMLLQNQSEAQCKSKVPVLSSQIMQVIIWAITLFTLCEVPNKKYTNFLLSLGRTAIGAHFITINHDGVKVDNFVELLGLLTSTSLLSISIRGKTGIVFNVVNGITDPLLNGKAEKGSESKRNCLYEKATLFKLISFSWLNPLFAVGIKKPLDQNEVPNVDIRDSARFLSHSFDESLKHVQERDGTTNPSIYKAMFVFIRKRAAINAFFAVTSAVASYVGPYLINDFVNFLNEKKTRGLGSGYLIALGFLGAKMVETTAERQWIFGSRQLGLWLRAALTSCIYKKGLLLSSQSRHGHSSGEIINYMSVDIQRISDFMWYLNTIWQLPIQISLAIFILHSNLGLGSLVALAATLVVMACNIPITRVQKTYQSKIMEAKDGRMKATSEVLRNIKILKLQAWDNQYLHKLESLRKTEYNCLWKSLRLSAISSFIFWGSPTFISVLTFGTCMLMGIPLTAGSVLSALATFQMLQGPIFNLPDLLSTIAQSKVSADRVASYLQEDEIKLDAIEFVPKDQTEFEVEVNGGTFSWEAGSRSPTLDGIQLRVKRGMKVAICGTVGSGKSSLFSSTLGEMTKLSGTVKISGTKAYVPQSPWIMSGNVRENILFGNPFDSAKYDRIVNVCALTKDFELFPAGDLTEIGERGINMSGGQKQRIQIARAVYQDADIYLLDDPFSALDAHTGTQLFEDCMSRILKDKTILYVTHQVEFLPAADLILVMQNGRIAQAGTFEILLKENIGFEVLVGAHNHALESIITVGSSSKESLNEIPDDEFNEDLTSVGELEHTKPDLENKPCVEITEKEARLVQDEEREKGSIESKVYWSYLTIVKGGSLVPIIILAQTMFQVLQIASNYWMAWACSTGGAELIAGKNFILLVYTLLAIGSSICVLIRAMLVAIAGILTSQKLFTNMLHSILSAPMEFFDSTPTGIILNRLLGAIVVMSQVAWELLVIFIPITAICIWYQRYYTPTARELARLAGIQLAPILHHFAESLSGAATIRAFDQKDRFIDANLNHIDNHSRSWFHNMAVRYAEHLPSILKNITCTFPGRKKVGVVGRTGSGKSTPIPAIFRIIEPREGSIIIDDVDISKIGLHDLRSRLSIIPQDPTMFEGIVRENLDPLQQYPDNDIWEVLNKCQLGGLVHAKEGKLDSTALLKRSSSLILDEATASVDSATDAVIQKVINQEFRDQTIVTIAHRIHTVIDSDLVLVLSEGRIAEFNTPAKLLEREDSFFSRLIKEYSMRSQGFNSLARLHN